MSAKTRDEFDSSLITGEKAFSSLTINTIPVWPDMYEVLYTYENGDNVDVVSAIDELKSKSDFLELSDLQKVHDELLSYSGLDEISEDIGSKINDEIRNILSAMSQAGEQSEQFDKALQKIETKFPNVSTPDQLRGVVDILTDITRAIADNNRTLSGRLDRSTQQINVLHKDLETARNESNTDALTGLANRKKLDLSLRKAFRKYDEEGGNLCLLLLDIDHFKNFNDSYGHQTGDQILRLVAHTLKNGVKGRDLAARYGGEEFAIILSNTTRENAFTVAEQIRKAVASKELIKRSTGENLGRLTISIGIAEAVSGDQASTLIERSDKALYQAKNSGRNRCIIADDDSQASMALPDIAV